jgi:hypothetical protein
MVQPSSNISQPWAVAAMRKGDVQMQREREREREREDGVIDHVMHFNFGRGEQIQLVCFLSLCLYIKMYSSM